MTNANDLMVRIKQLDALSTNIWNRGDISAIRKIRIIEQVFFMVNKLALKREILLGHVTDPVIIADLFPNNTPLQ